MRVSVLGDRNFESEDLLAYETGYRVNLGRAVSFDMAAFYNSYADLPSAEPAASTLDLETGPVHLVAPLMVAKIGSIDNLIDHAYTLEVSSPGLDRPFKRLQDYRRAIGKRVTLKLREPLAGQWRLVGTLTDVADQTVTLTVDDRPTVRAVTLEQRVIAEAKRAVTW